MKIILPVITALFAGVLVFFVMRPHRPASAETNASGELALCGQEVSKRLKEMSEDVGARLSAFAAEVAADQLFSLRLLAEDNRSAPEVTAKAGQFIRPMGFSVLSILDSASVILSSGDFPASAGNSASKKAAALSDAPKFFVDRIMGKNVLTLQAKKTIRIVDSIPLYTVGGIAIDDSVLMRLSPREGVVVLVKQGSAVAGMAGVRTISEIKNGKIVINDKEYPAFDLPLPFVGEGDPPVIITVLQSLPAQNAGRK
jgi:hypothetical protein